jgi:hypothetical protein
MVIVEDPPGTSTMGSDAVVAVNPEPATVTCEKVTLGPPAADELVSVIAFATLLPTVTLPKLRLEVLRLRLAGVTFVDVWPI